MPKARPVRVSGMVLGPRPRGVGHSVVQVPVQVIGPSCPFQARFLAGNAVILGVGHGIESLGEAVAALTQGLAVLGDGEVHPVPGFPVDAVFLHKVQAALGSRQPFRLHAVAAAQECKDPAAAALHPDALIGGKNFPRPVQAGVHAAMDAVHAVFQPKVHAAVQFFPDPGLCLAQFDLFHSNFLRFIFSFSEKVLSY